MKGALTSFRVAVLAASLSLAGATTASAQLTSPETLPTPSGNDEGADAGDPPGNAAGAAAPPPASAPSAATPGPASPPATPVTSTAGAELDEESAKYVADLMAQTGGGGPGGAAKQAFSPSLKFYGFADFMVQKYILLSDPWKGALNDNLSFGVSHINLYADADIAPGWKSMIEVRFLFQPDGATSGNIGHSTLDPLATSGRTDSATHDFYDSSRVVDLGGIAIARAYVEYALSPYLKVRAGHFLTPWGIWNVDHGSPVIIGPSKPYIVGEQFFPESQTGFELLGTAPVGDATLGYHLTVSNGRGPAQVLEDLDGNKALGGRLFLRGYWLGQIDIGASAYGGTVTDRRQQVTDLASQRVGWFDYSKYREISWAADLRWLWKGLHFQSEAALHDRAWDDNARPPGQYNMGYQADVRRLGMYSLVGYRLPWLNLMPYTLFSYYDAGLNVTFLGAHRIMAFAGGLNMRVTPTVVLKTEVQVGKFLGAVAGSLPASGSVNIWSTQIAWAF